MSKTWSEEKKGIERFEDLDYRSCIGFIINLATGTRYNIMFAVTKLAKFVSDPGVKHYAALIWLLQYIRGNSNHALKYYNDYSHSPVFTLYHDKVSKNEKKK